MKKQNLKKELSPILENEHMQIGTFKVNREINSYSIINNNINLIRDNIKFWKSYDGHKLPEKQVKRAYYNGTRTQNIIKMYINTPELIKFVREHANDYKTLRIKREFPCLQAGDDSVFVYTFFWFSIYFLTVSSDICPTDSTK